MEKKSVREKIEEICNGRLPSLYDVATKIGFKKDPMECSQRSVCMRIGAAGGGEKILIYDNGQKYKNLRSGKCPSSSWTVSATTPITGPRSTKNGRTTTVQSRTCLWNGMRHRTSRKRQGHTSPLLRKDGKPNRSDRPQTYP